MSRGCGAGAQPAFPSTPGIKSGVEYEVTPRHVTIIERRVPWRAEYGSEWTKLPVARLHYTSAGRGTWRLFWRDRHGRFHAYDRLPPSASLEQLLAEIDSDPTGIFWG